MPSTLSPAAKAKVAAASAVALAAITAWQAVTADGFTPLDLVPVVAAAAGAACTDLVPNTPGQPKAKAIVHWALSAVAAVASAVAALSAADPGGETAAKLLTVAVGAFLVWYVPEAAPVVKAVEGDVQRGAPAARVIADAALAASNLMGADLPNALTAAPPVVDERAEITDALRQLDALDAASTSSSPVPAPPPESPTPTYDEVAAALAAAPVPAAIPTQAPAPVEPVTAPLPAIAPAPATTA